MMKEKDSRVYYVSHTGIELSETFLVQMGTHLAKSFKLIFLSGAKGSSYPLQCKTYYLGFNHLSIIDRAYLKFNKALGLDVDSKEWELRRRRALRKVQPLISRGDIVFIEYGVAAVLLRPLIETFELRVVFTLHGYDASTLLNSAFYRNELKLVYNLCELCIVPSHHVRRRLTVDLGIRGKFKVLPCWPDESIRALVGKRVVTGKLVSVGRLAATKGPLAIIEAVNVIRRRFPTVKLVMIGDGPLRDDVVNRIGELGLEEHVELTGALSNEVSLSHVADCDIFLHHSVTGLNGDQEGMPVAIMEALLLEKFVISTIHSGIPELVGASNSGRVVQEHDFEKMAEIALECLENHCGGSSFSLKMEDRGQFASNLIHKLLSS